MNKNLIASLVEDYELMSSVEECRTLVGAAQKILNYDEFVLFLDECIRLDKQRVAALELILSKKR